MADAPHPLAPRRLTFEQARAEQRLYWSTRSIPERLAAMVELTRTMYKLRGIDLDEPNPDLTPRFVRRSRG